MTPRMNRQLRRNIVRQACDATPAAARKMSNQLLGHQRLLCVPFLWQDQEMYASIFVRGPLPDVPNSSADNVCRWAGIGIDPRRVSSSSRNNTTRTCTGCRRTIAPAEPNSTRTPDVSAQCAQPPRPTPPTVDWHLARSRA